MKYRKKPVVIDAIQWNGKNHREMFDFLTNYELTNEFMSTSGENFYIDHNKIKGGLIIKTLEGEHLASIGDYIIKGVKGEFYPCKPDIFKETYETVSMVSDNDRTTVPMSEYRKLENKNKKLRNTINRLKRELEVED